MQCRQASPVTPQASSSGRNRHRTWPGHTPRRQKEEGPHQGSRPPPGTEQSSSVCCRPSRSRAALRTVLSRWQQPRSPPSLYPQRSPLDQLRRPGPDIPDRRRDFCLCIWCSMVHRLIHLERYRRGLTDTTEASLSKPKVPGVLARVDRR